MREAAFWWQQALQAASDERDDEEQKLRGWDPTAAFDPKQELRRFLAADGGGNLRRALGALQKAERLASTPTERARAQRHQRAWEEVSGRLTARASRMSLTNS